MRPTLRRRGLWAGALLVTLSGATPSPARAGKHDLDLLKLCEPRTAAPGSLNGQVLECNWIERQPNGLIDRVTVPALAEARFRTLMSELGTVMAPRLVMPAQTLGFSGFQVAAELGITAISANRSHWDGVEGVSAQNRSAARPDAWLTTVGAFVRKGVWLGLPAVELGAGVVNLIDSRLLAWQGYAKVALHEGFDRWPVPSLAVRGGVSYLTGTDQARMTVTSLDVIASKGFGVLGTFHLEPYAAWSLLHIHASAGVLDATPSCDAFRVRNAGAGDSLGEYCAEAQRGTGNDDKAYVVLSRQSPIRRQRLSAGAKIRFATVFITGQYDLFPAGRTRDGRKANGARDESSQQKGVSLSGGFDF